jgi:hypothetical protein
MGGLFFDIFLMYLYLTRQVSYKQILIYNDGLPGNSGLLPYSGAEQIQILTFVS